MKKGNLYHPTFARCADLILDAVEEAFSLPRPGSRSATKRALISILNHYTEPKPFEEVTVRKRSKKLRRSNVEC